MRIALLGRNIEKFQRDAIDKGFEIDTCNPEVIVTIGGDGTLLGSEREYPGIPKLGLRYSTRPDAIYENSDINQELHNLANGKYDNKIKEFFKLNVKIGNNKIVGLNDISIKPTNPLSAIRCLVNVNGNDYTNIIIGDGLVVSTPLGSNAYYRSITHSIFQVGIGIAFNNCTESVDHLVVDENSIIKIHIKRGPAFIAADNDQNIILVNENDEIIIEKDLIKAKLIIPERNGKEFFRRLV